MDNIQRLRDKYATIEDERFFKELFEKEEYLTIRSKPLNVVIDIGALAGEFGTYIYDLAGIIYAVEPYPPYYKELEENIREFNLEKMKPFNLALAGYNGTGMLSANVARGANGLSRESEEKVEIPTKTLATFMNENNIAHVDVLKVDIEGDEELVFLSPDFKDVAPMITLIIGEHLGGVRNALENFGFTMQHDRCGNTIFER